MRRRLDCGSVFPGCRLVIHADGDDELMAKVLDHARAEHQGTQITDRLKSRLRSAFRTEEEASPAASG